MSAAESKSESLPSVSAPLIVLTGRSRSAYSIDLSQARIDPEVVPPWSNLKKASQEQLDDGAGIDVDAVLAEAGGEVGLSEMMLGDESRRRRQCCAFPSASSLPPVASYVLTRLLPLNHGYSG